MDLTLDPDNHGVDDAPLAVGLALAPVDGLEAENRRLELDLDDMRGENRRLRAAVQQMQAEILILSRALEPMHRVNEELADLRLQFAGLEANELQRANEEQQRVAQLHQYIQALHASSSWRLTRPWRVLGRLVKAIMAGTGSLRATLATARPGCASSTAGHG